MLHLRVRSLGNAPGLLNHQLVARGVDDLAPIPSCVPVFVSVPVSVPEQDSNTATLFT